MSDAAEGPSALGRSGGCQQGPPAGAGPQGAGPSLPLHSQETLAWARGSQGRTRTEPGLGQEPPGAQSGRQEQSRHSGALALRPEADCPLRGRWGAETGFPCRSRRLLVSPPLFFDVSTTRAKADIAVGEGHSALPSTLTNPTRRKHQGRNGRSWPWGACTARRWGRFWKARS